jgi:TPP-dependent pyruvate/acetoin dehydrogenase alpha subunit
MWLRRDPVHRMRAALDASGLSEQAAEAEQAATATIDDAVEFAESSPPATGKIA